MSRANGKDAYRVAIITALPIERAAVTAMLDAKHTQPHDFQQRQVDNNSYTWGAIGQHNVVITSLPAGVYGETSATATCIHMRYAFPCIRWGLMIGIAAGIPSKDRDIRLGDVVVSQPNGTVGGVFQYDLGKIRNDEWERRDWLAKPPDVLLRALNNLQAEHELNGPSRAHDYLDQAILSHEHWAKSYGYPPGATDQLFPASYTHRGPETDCRACDSQQVIERRRRESDSFQVHYGIIGSGNSLIKDAKFRDQIAKRVKDCICLEMEAAGLMNDFPCLIIRGICDYADSHKNDMWQRYASATAAAYAKEFLSYISVTDASSKSCYSPTEALSNSTIQDKKDPTSSYRIGPSITTTTFANDDSHIAQAQFRDADHGAASPTSLVRLQPEPKPRLAADSGLQPRNNTSTKSATTSKNSTSITSPMIIKPTENVGVNEDIKQNDQDTKTGARNRLQQALTDATVAGNLAVVESLVQQGARLSLQDSQGRTALHYATSYGHETIAKFCLDNGVDIEAKDFSGQTALHHAAWTGQERILRLLLDTGADIEAKDTHEQTVLHMAVSFGDIEVVKSILCRETKLNARNSGGNTALHVAIANNSAEIAVLLLERGADISARNDKGDTALHLALHSQSSAQELTELLLVFGAHLDAKGQDDETVLHLAIRQKQLEIAKFILKQHPDLTVRKRGGFTALHIAAGYGRADLVELLLQQGADIESESDKQATPLHSAASWGHIEVVKQLLDKGANPQAQDNSKWRPINWARSEKHEQVVKLLEDSRITQQEQGAQIASKKIEVGSQSQAQAVRQTDRKETVQSEQVVPPNNEAESEDEEQAAQGSENQNILVEIHGADDVIELLEDIYTVVKDSVKDRVRRFANNV